MFLMHRFICGRVSMFLILIESH